MAIIPARGGSKGLPGKNICQLGGKPLIAWSIEAALNCPSLGRVVVSTDDQEIAHIASSWGAEVPFIRPAELAGDNASAEGVVFHALNWLEQSQGYIPSIVCLLQPTSPLRTSQDITNALAIMHETNSVAVVSVTPNPRPVEWLRRLGAAGEIIPYQTGAELKQRQCAEPLYLLNGAIYLINTTTLRQTRTFYPENSVAYIMPNERSIDIDTRLDLVTAEALLQEPEL